ncbi:MAG: hypothetical protein ACO23R_02570 [bacterium]
MNSESWESLKRLGEELSIAEANRTYLIEFRKSKKAMLMVECESNDPTASIAKQERYAYAHQEYLELIDGLRVATEQAARLKHEMSVWQMRFETWRTQQATNRAEMNLR